MTMTEKKPVGIGDTVYIVNHDTTPHTFKWDRKKFLLEPNRRVPVPFEAVCLWTGDPRASAKMASVRTEGGDVMFVPDRETEVRRLKIKYGGEENFIFPNLSVTTLDDDPIVTVLEDLEGNTVNPAVQTVTEASTQADAVRLLQAQVARLTALLEPQGGDLTEFVNQPPEPEGSGDIPEDTVGSGTSSKGPGS